jgi:hypothetical protein
LKWLVANFVAKNEMAQDIQIAKKKFTGLFEDKVIDSVPDPDSIGCPLIRLRGL